MVIMTIAREIARFSTQRSFEDISKGAVKDLKCRILDSIGCAVGALDGEPVRVIRRYLEDLGGNPICSMIGGGWTSPERAALYNGALVRYLDFNDSYLAKGETCHPSDNLGAILAAVEYAGGCGKDLLTALAIAYQVHTRLSDEAPVRHRGFDHTVQGSYAVATGVSKALSLTMEKTANAIAISGTAFNALRVTRTGRISHWKGLAYPNTAFGGTHAAFLAKGGITGPEEVFEGNKGFCDSIAGRFEIDWSKEDLEGVKKTIIKKYNAEIHSQPSIEGILELQREHGFSPDEVEKIEIDVFDVAFHIIGGGEEGNKWEVVTKEDADHSLPYMVAVALLDGDVMPQQYQTGRILKEDVQTLLRKISVRPDASFSELFPHEMKTLLTVHFENRGRVSKVKNDYEGFHTRPMSWEGVRKKFERLSSAYVNPEIRGEIADVVEGLEYVQVTDLTTILGNIFKKREVRAMPRQKKGGKKIERGFQFLHINERDPKPRSCGVTEIRGPYYTPLGKRQLEDILETMCDYIDSIKFAGGSFVLMDKRKLKEIIELAHSYDVMVSTGGFIEYVMTQGPEAVGHYIRECRDLGFDILEISSGFISISSDDWLRLVEKVHAAGLKAKPEVGIQFGAGGDTRVEELEREGTRDTDWMIHQAEKFLDAGAYMIMVESEGITENVKSWRTDVISKFISRLGLEKCMFEAADPEVFSWYVKNYGPDVNLFVDHSQIVQLETLRRGMWGTKSLWGRVVSFKEKEAETVIRLAK